MNKEEREAIRIPSRMGRAVVNSTSERRDSFMWE